MEILSDGEHANNQQQDERLPILLSDEQLQRFFDLRKDMAKITYRQERMIARIDELYDQLIGSQGV
jgi:hypothetical protein